MEGYKGMPEGDFAWDQSVHCTDIYLPVLLFVKLLENEMISQNILQIQFMHNWNLLISDETFMRISGIIPSIIKKNSILFYWCNSTKYFIGYKKIITCEITLQCLFGYLVGSVKLMIWIIAPYCYCIEKVSQCHWLTFTLPWIQVPKRLDAFVFFSSEVTNWL